VNDELKAVVRREVDIYLEQQDWLAAAERLCTLAMLASADWRENARKAKADVDPGPARVYRVVVAA